MRAGGETELPFAEAAPFLTKLSFGEAAPFAAFLTGDLDLDFDANLLRFRISVDGFSIGGLDLPRLSHDRLLSGDLDLLLESLLRCGDRDLDLSTTSPASRFNLRSSSSSKYLFSLSTLFSSFSSSYLILLASFSSLYFLSLSSLSLFLSS